MKGAGIHIRSQQDLSHGLALAAVAPLVATSQRLNSDTPGAVADFDPAQFFA